MVIYEELPLPEPFLSIDLPAQATKSLHETVAPQRIGLWWLDFSTDITHLLPRFGGTSARLVEAECLTWYAAHLSDVPVLSTLAFSESGKVWAAVAED